MGVLDDAIREHLELKRRHGAAEDEVRRQAEEALGPARREVAPQAEDEHLDAEGAAAVAADQGEPDLAPEHQPELSEAVPAEAVRSDALPLEEAHDPEGLHEEAVEPEALDPERLDPEPLSEAPIEHADSEGAPRGDTPARGFVPVEDEPFAEDEDFLHGDPSRPSVGPVADDEDIDPAVDPDADQEGGPDADVLEDTPDFLQETPEHDRLWFEQKPPRDFDFD